MPDTCCLPIGGMRFQVDGILLSFGTTKEIIISLTRLSSTTYSLIFSYFSLLRLDFYFLKYHLLLHVVTSLNCFKSNSDLSGKRSSWKYSTSKFDLASKSPLLTSLYRLNDPEVNIAIFGALLLDNYSIAPTTGICLPCTLVILNRSLQLTSLLPRG